MMKQLFWILTLCTLSAGCRLCQNAARTIILEPFHFPQYVDECMERRRHRRLATLVWNEVESRDCIQAVSGDYMRGFEDGFVDFMMAGGTGAPPPLAPRRYWKVRYQTPEGHRAIQDWFAGFTHGATVAQSHGYRRLVIIPSALSFVHGIHPFLDLQERADGYPARGSPDEPAQENEVIPLPQPRDIPSPRPDLLLEPAMTNPTIETSQGASEGQGKRVARASFELLPPVDGKSLTDRGSGQ